MILAFEGEAVASPRKQDSLLFLDRASGLVATFRVSFA